MVTTMYNNYCYFNRSHLYKMVVLNRLVVVVVVVVVVLTRVSLQENTEMDVFAWRPKKILTRWP